MYVYWYYGVSLNQRLSVSNGAIQSMSDAT